MILVPKPDLTQAQAQVQAASARAGAYLSSWGTWAAEKRKTGWNRTSSPGHGAADIGTKTGDQVLATKATSAGDDHGIAPETNAWNELGRNLDYGREG